MFTRTHEHTRGLSSHRQALLSAMSVYLTAPFFRRWIGWISPDVPRCQIGISRLHVGVHRDGGNVPRGGHCNTSTSRPC